MSVSFLRMRLQMWMIPVLSLATILSACGDRPATPSGVVVTIPPLAWAVSALVDPATPVRTLVPAGVSVHAYEPSAEDAAAIARAAVVVEVGLGLEGPLNTVVRRRAAKDARFEWASVAGIEIGDDHHGHAHAPDEPCPHDHSGPDAHLWVDPVLMHDLAAPLATALERAGIAGATARAGVLREQAARIDAEYRERLAPFAGRAIVTQHDAWSRLAERYGLRVVEVLLPRGSIEPTSADLADVAEALRSAGVAGVFTEPQFDPRPAQRLAELGGVRVGVIDPLGDGDWPAVMRRNLDELVRVLSAPDTAPGAS